MVDLPDPATGELLARIPLSSPPEVDAAVVAAREFAHRIEAGMVRVVIGVPAPAPYFPLAGWNGSVHGDLAASGREAVRFYTRTKVVTTRWF
ncbi:MAG: hypothetical protein L3K19_09410 [Thermoplasmata archaeon]|nr:hypothetical protein [Thermoplasmata archaeon]